MFHRDFPSDAQEMWEIIAKALMLRSGGAIKLTLAEIRAAAEAQAEIDIRDDIITLRRETN